MDAFSSNQAAAQGNSMMRVATEHNDAVRAHNQRVLQQLSLQDAGLDAQKKMDKMMNNVQDVFSTSGALSTSMSTFKEAQKSGGFLKYVQGDGGIGNIKRQYNSVGNFVKGQIYGDTGKPAIKPTEFEMQDMSNKAPVKALPTNLDDKPNTVGTAAEEPLRAEDVPAKPASVAGTSTEPVGQAKLGKPPSATSVEKVGNTASEVEEGSSKTLKVASDVGEGIGTLSKGLGAIGSISAVTQDVVSGKIAGDNTADKVSNVASIVSGALDVASIFVPVLAPLAAIAGAVGAISGGIGEVEDLHSKKVNDAKNAQASLGNTVNAFGLASSGLVASTGKDNTQKIVGTSAF
tara:strand:+ start:835 stop:1875 length:1041 start_codon:yes stop_codon:yes gene_type:complete